MNIKTVALTALLLTGGSAAASAAPILSGSTISFQGASNCTSTTCTLTNASVNGTSTGSFAAFTAGNLATFSPIVFNPFTSQQVYTTTQASLTTTFTVTSQVSLTQLSTPSPAGTFLLTSIVDSGFATLTGFDNTPGTSVFTANQNGTVTGTFSATAAVAAAAVPEPVSISLLGAGLIGMGFVRRRANKAG